MVKDVAQILIDRLNAQNAGLFNTEHCKKIGYLDERGRVVDADSGGRAYSGIDDRYGNYYYLRYRDQERTAFATSRRLGSTGHNYETRTAMRLVAFFKDYDKGEITRKLVNDMTGFHFENTTWKFGINLQLGEVFGTWDDVIQQEVGRTIRKRSRDYRLVAIDFEVVYRADFDACAEYEVCDGVVVTPTDVQKNFVQTLTCEKLLSWLTKVQKLDCLLPSYDFSEQEIIDSLTGKQVGDLIAALCGFDLEDGGQI